MTRRWLAVALVYLAALVLLAVLIVTESDTGAQTRAVELAVFVGIPALAFLVSAAPLWRESRNRVALVTAAALAVVVAFALTVLTLGFGLPVSLGLVAIAIADLDRALLLSGLRGSRRVFALGALLTVGGFLIGLAAPIAALLAVVGIGVVAWKLVTARRCREGTSPGV